MSDPGRRPAPRSARFDTFEERLVLSAHPLAAGWIDAAGSRAPAHPPLRHFDELAPSLLASARSAPTLANVHQTTGVADVRGAYGFDGWGQTVAIIDSGIAYDHQALGRGFGSGTRVVGGWDFAENDANPFDDGPAGFHGTHVAGIVGSSDRAHQGVAPGVDLVALRVFDDNGAGNFQWVEQALQWVHAHRNDYRFPITTVNMSIGTDWNATSVPNWSTIEDELTQLERDGVFVSVAAGNSFSQYRTPGLSYPASSPHVVPVMSVSASGTLSAFSQRHDRAIGAPGQNITSTVPDHVLGADGVANDFASASGTSMAAPYLAGVSALVRQAMQFAGRTAIDRSVIDSHLRATADSFVDSATQATYLRVNAGRAIESIMPSDDWGNSAPTAGNLGTLSRSLTVSGTIGRLDDVDFFTFTAGISGRVRVAATSTGRMAPRLMQGEGPAPGAPSDSIALDVEAGHAYSLGIRSAFHIGHYQLAFTLEGQAEPPSPSPPVPPEPPTPPVPPAPVPPAPPAAIDLGRVAQRTVNDLDLNGSARRLELRAERDGILTVEGLFDAADGPVAIEVQSASGERLSVSAPDSGGLRLDLAVRGNESYVVCLSGANRNVDLRITNLVAVTGTELFVYGTDGDDSFDLTSGDSGRVSVNGVAYPTASQAYSRITVDGQAGRDAARIQGSGAAERFILGAGTFTASSSAPMVGSNIEDVTVDGGGGADTAYLYGTSGDERFVGGARTGTLQGDGFRTSVSGMRRIMAYGRGGSDSATLEGDSGPDIFFGHANQSWIVGVSGSTLVHGFKTVTADGSDGTDTAYLYDSAGDDRFTGAPTYASLEGGGFSNRVESFERVHAFATAGRDVARLYDSPGNDRFLGYVGNSRLVGASFLLRAVSFDEVHAYATAGGSDAASLYGGGAGSRYTVMGGHTHSLAFGTATATAEGFESTTVYAAPGGGVLRASTASAASALSAHAASLDAVHRSGAFRPDLLDSGTRSLAASRCAAPRMDAVDAAIHRLATADDAPHSDLDESAIVDALFSSFGE